MEQRAEALLKEWLSSKVRIERSRSSDACPDLLVREGTTTLAVEVKRLGDPGWLVGSIEQARAAARRVGRNAVPVVVVPFMSDLGRKICDEAKVSWFDLSGNASITAHGLRIHIEGKPNLFKRPGRPSTVFAPKSSRVVRILLLEPERAFRQRELAEQSGLDEGFVSRIVRKLETDRMVRRFENGSLKTVDPNLLLDSWREGYEFAKHTILPGHVTAKSGAAALAAIAHEFGKRKLDYATTGLSCAWVLTEFATFRLVTFFLPEKPSDGVLKAIGFRPEERGANVWFVVPNDEGVFAGASDHLGVRCVHPVQAYLDLKGQPERSAEAAEELRKRHLVWSA